MEEKKLMSALEAILFAAGDSVEAGRIAAVLGVSEDALHDAAASLVAAYEREGRGIRLVRLENRYQLCSAPEWSDEIVRLLEKRRTARLSPAALEVLSIVAYYQPVTRTYIEKIRGVDSSYTVSYLSERGLIAPCGRLEAPGRPTLFGTTEEFLRVMGVASLEELPPLPDVASDEGMAQLRSAIESHGEAMQMELTDVEALKGAM
ncbi:MAG: SMC-Scp complex subunit ScpB [Ruminococcaceae bacterium]|nr:SMC-Scp complex subunit ScpB [Oscillospiraceae bacterium]